jgi:hypothetical protein
MGTDSHYTLSGIVFVTATMVAFLQLCLQYNPVFSESFEGLLKMTQLEDQKDPGRDGGKGSCVWEPGCLPCLGCSLTVSQGPQCHRDPTFSRLWPKPAWPMMSLQHLQARQATVLATGPLTLANTPSLNMNCDWKRVGSYLRMKSLQS